MTITRTLNRSQHNSNSIFWYGSGLTMIVLTLSFIENNDLKSFCVCVGVGFIIGGRIIELYEYHRPRQSLPSNKPSSQLPEPQKQNVKEQKQQKQPVYIEPAFRHFKGMSRRQNEEKIPPGKSWQTKGRDITNVVTASLKHLWDNIPKLLHSVSQSMNMFLIKKEEIKKEEMTEVLLKPKEQIGIHSFSENGEEEKATNLNGIQIATSSFSSTDSAQCVDSSIKNVIQQKKQKTGSSKKVVPASQVELLAEDAQKIKKKKKKKLLNYS